MITSDRLRTIRTEKAQQLENVRIAYIQIEAQIALLDEMLGQQDALTFDELRDTLGAVEVGEPEEVQP